VAAAPRVSPASRGRRKPCAASLNYARASHEVAKGNIKTAKQLADLMVKDVVPADATFEAAFSEARVGKAYLALKACTTPRRRPATAATPLGFGRGCHYRHA
jgi:hypothetical protein